MAPSRPTSPTSLLWAHQLKREHGFLLKRMQDLESNQNKYENRIKSAEHTVKTASNPDIAALTARVNDLERSNLLKILNNMENTFSSKIDDVKSENKTLTQRVATLQKINEDRAAAEAPEKASSQVEALLQRIEEVECSLEQYSTSLTRVGRILNQWQAREIKQRLDSLTEQVRRDGERTELLAEHLHALEMSNDILKQENAKLEVEVKMLAARAASSPSLRSDRVTDSEGESSQSDDELANLPQKSTFADSGASAAHMKKSPAVPDDAIPKKNIKPHRWAGGGADKEILQADLAIEKPRRPKLDPAAQAKLRTPKMKRPVTGKTGDGPTNEGFLRHGLGWYEVPVSPEKDLSASTSTPAKRRRGRPKKEKPPTLTEEEMAQGRITRHGSRQLAQTPPRANLSSTKRRAEDEPDGAPAHDKPPKTKQNAADSLSLPVHSENPQLGTGDTHEDDSRDDLQAERVTAPNLRREIKQYDDISVIMNDSIE